MSPPRLISSHKVASSRLVDSAFRLLLVSALVLCGSHAASVASPGRPRVVLILVDGVRWDYLSESDLPGFGELAKTGVKAEYVVPIMPANSYPNWYSIVTGLYGERHGFVQNYMYDDQYDDFFMMAPHPNASHPHWWNHAEPVWVTAEKNGLRTGMYWWDGCQLSLIVVSDHGMTDTRPEKFHLIDIEPHIDANDLHSMLDGGSFVMLRPYPDKIDKVYSKLKSLNIKGLNVFRKEELPDLYHLKETHLTQPIVLTADPGYQIKKLQGTDKQVPQSNKIYNGNHGYDPMKLEDMRAIFLATGPGLKQGFQNGPVRMVDHYNVICRQLGIKPLENSGSQDNVQGMFVGGASGSSTAVSLSLLVVPNILLAARSYLYH
ncbi:hypothetical protein HPB51_009605 [Rhipicephalus microplus]|uniref:glycerophosphocholine cholinephosphodiesterase n=1 Tax=Rhipicephalus microplus TaxID=6941 RepID=A0A9J6DM43_RHIMP|nr:hypothetical protein HPB51_009605 [Rhipicephalus microplus]